MALSLQSLWRALRGTAIECDRWVEAEATESRATLGRMGIIAVVTADDIRNVTRWSAQARREQLDIAWEAQAKREEMNIASERQRKPSSEEEGREE